MKKRLLSVLLCCSLICSTLIGCGKTEVTEPEMPSVSKLADEGATKEVTKATEAVEEITVVDYSKAYDNYFDTWEMPSDNFEMVMYFKTSDGELSDSAFSVRKSGDDMALVGGTEDNCIGFYALGDDMYFHFNINSGMLAEEGGSDENGWYVFHKTNETSESLDTDEVTSMTDDMTDFNADDVMSVKYLDTVEENGVVYDRLTISTKVNSDTETSVGENSTEDDSEVTEYTVWINRDTQALTKMSTYDESTNAEILIVFSTIDSIQLPNYNGGAEELTEEETLGMMMSVMFGAIMMAMPEDMLNSDMSDSNITFEPAEDVTVVE